MLADDDDWLIVDDEINAEINRNRRQSSYRSQKNTDDIYKIIL